MTIPTAVQRRAAFYEAESREFDRNKRTFRPEEPNVRVYARSVCAVLETARKGLSPEGFGSLIAMLAEEYPAPTTTAANETPESETPKRCPYASLGCIDGTCEWCYVHTVMMGVKSRESKHEREKADRPVHVTDLPKDGFIPVKNMMVAMSALSPYARERVEERGGALFIRHADLYGKPEKTDALQNVYTCCAALVGQHEPHCPNRTSPAVPPEAPKPTARAHLNGCTLEGSHTGGCLVESRGGVRQSDGQPSVPTTRESTALSPRQALGEALACLKRASELLSAPWALDAINSEALRMAAEASRTTDRAIREVSFAYRDAT